MFRTIARNAAAAAIGLTLIAPTAVVANWHVSHRRRAEVNARLRDLDHSIGQERREGDLTNTQARYLRREDGTIPTEEGDIAR